MTLLNRIGYSLRMLRQHRQRLATIYRTNPPIFSVQQLCPHQLKQAGITVLVLDFDGVLAGYGEIQPLAAVQIWLQTCVAVFGAERVFILSNQPLPARIAFFDEKYPGLQYITEVKKKPYPDGLEKIIALTGQPANQIMLVDDRLLTGVLAACIAQTQVVYITRPYIKLTKQPVHEVFFIVLRFLERCLLACSSPQK